MTDLKKNKLQIEEQEEEQIQQISNYSETDSDSDSDNDIDIENIDKKDDKIILKIKKLAEKLNLTYTEENSIKLEKNKINPYRKCYFLINTNLILMNDENKEQKKLNNIINNNLTLIKKELDIKELPKIENEPIFEFVYGIDFKNNKTKVYLGYFPEEFEVGKSFEFDGNKKTKRTYYQKQIKSENIFKKYKLLESYNTLFNYKNFEMYYIRKNNDKIDQVGLIYTNNMKIKNFISLFINICDKVKWDKKKLLKILYHNQDKILNIISFGEDYINIYFLEDNNQEELTKEEIDKIHKKTDKKNNKKTDK